MIWRRLLTPHRSIWHPLYERTYKDFAGGCFGIAADDLTGDGHRELVTYKNLDGSGGCAVARVIGTERNEARILFRRGLCDGAVRLEKGEIVLDKSIHRKNCNVHGCEGVHRVIRLQWDGSQFVQLSNRVLRGNWRY